jgi:hypothetical protein
MSLQSFSPMRPATPGGTLLILAVWLAPAHAALIPDPVGDFLSTYTGPHDPGLDVLAHEVTLVGDRLNFFGQMAGPIAPTQEIGGLYVPQWHACHWTECGVGLDPAHQSEWHWPLQ